MAKRAGAYVSPHTLEARTRAWLREVRELTRPRPKLRLSPERCALLVVDMIEYFAQPEGRAFLPATEAIAPRIAKLVALWRRLGAPLAFTRHGHDGPEDLGMLGRFYSDYIREGLPESRIIRQLEPREGEPVFRKRTYDAFWGTALQELLEGWRVEQLLLAGVLTHRCCETTARSAFVRGFEVYVPADATASSSERLHLGSLLSMADSCAVVLSVEEVEQLCTSKT